MELNRREAQISIIERMLTFTKSEEFVNTEARLIKRKLELLNEAFDKFQEEHLKIVEANVEQENMSVQSELHENIQEMYLEAFNKLESRREEIQADQNANSVRANHINQQGAENPVRNSEQNELPLQNGDAIGSANGQDENVHTQFNTNQERQNHSHQARIEIDEFLLDRFKPPKFHGIYSKWSEWRSSFDSMVHNTSLPDTKKMYLLKQCLSGQAERILGGWQVTGENYAAAYKSLCDIYENRYRIIMAHLDELKNIPRMAMESYEGLRAMIDTTNSVLRQLRVCGSPVEQWDHMLVHHLITRMPPKISASWETSHNLSEMPKVEMVLKFLEKRARGQLNINQTSDSVQHI